MRKKKWRNRKGAGLLALALTCVLALSGTGALDSQAADAVDVNKNDCTLTVNASDLEIALDKDYVNKYDGSALDAKPEDVKLTIALYRVADIDVSGRYTALSYVENEKVVMDGKERGTFGQIVSVVNSNTTQADWLAMADAVSGAVESAPEDAAFTPKVADKDNGYTVLFEGLKTGLYLVMPQQVETPYYMYNFTPYLISLPSNFYVPENEESDDSWIYNVVSVLKMESEARQGKLEVKKNLLDMNGTPGSNSPAFVFKITIDPLKGEMEERYEMLEFSEIGTKPFIIEGIPAGSTVTVEEVYSGAGYETADGTSNFWKGVVGANDYSDENVSAISIDFTNQSDGTTTGGSGIRNHFFKDENGSYQYDGPYGSHGGSQSE